MIAQRHNVIWIKAGMGRWEPFSEKRLTASIRLAAEAAGHLEWWMAESIAQAVREYLRDREEKDPVTCEVLAHVVESLLEMIGFGEIAGAYKRREHHGQIRLDEIAGAEADGFELQFFRRLDAALAQAEDDQLALLHVSGLRPCVKQLRQARRWGDRCNRLADEILRHVRRRVEQFRANDAVTLNLTVTED